MTFDFALSTETTPDGVHIVAIRGEVDIFTAPDLRKEVVDAIENGIRRLVVDLTETRFVDSTGLGVLIGALRRLRPLDGRLVVVNTEPTTAKTFEITGLDQLLSIVATRDEAIELTAEAPAAD